MKNIICLLLISFATTIVCAQKINAPAKTLKVLPAAKDADFDSKAWQPLRPDSRALAYSIWITVDGKLHVNTSLALSSGEVEFVFPTASSSGNGTSTGSGGSMSKKLSINAQSNLAYAFDISKDNYKKVHKIIVTITAGNGAKQVVTLTNSKVPATINN